MNHGSPYKEMFNHNLVSNFAYIFQQVSEKVRSNLYKLRITWGGNFQIFTPAVLHQLDLRIKKIDPAWPVIHPKPVASPPRFQTAPPTPRFTSIQTLSAKRQKRKPRPWWMRLR